MSYSVKEIFYTLQGEGAQAGRPAVFCRFSGCNLWSGREQDRNNAACWFCDTDFVGTDGQGGGKFATAEQLAQAVAELWPNDLGSPMVVCTGGEPLLQLDTPLIRALKNHDFEIAVETNGTILAPDGIDWLTVSPKPKGELLQKTGTELKLVFPHEIQPASVEHLEFDYFYLSPLTCENEAETNTHLQQALAYCRSHPKWRLTMQYHKIWGIP